MPERYLGRSASVAPDSADASITAAGSAGSYTFNHRKNKVIVSVDPDYTGKLKIAWNGTASATVWDAPGLEGGGYAASPDGLEVLSVSIYAENANATYQTDFNVRGW